jgi:hypothetical protein
MGAHRDPYSRLTFSQWRRYRRLYRAMVIGTGRARQPLDRSARSTLKAEARRVARGER